MLSHRIQVSNVSIKLMLSVLTISNSFSHEISHEEYVRIAEVVESGGIIPSGLSKHEQDGVEAALLSVGREDSDVMWLRPAHDGLLVLIENGEPVDETYKV